MSHKGPTHLPVVIGMVTGVAFLFFAVRSPDQLRNLDQVALGQQTHSYFAEIDGAPIHCSDFKTIGDCLTRYRDTSDAL